MQMFGVGILEIMVILTLAVLVVGPERLPQVSAELAQWIRRGRAYARHLTSDFNEVVAELEQEVGATQEDWKEISEVVSSETEGVTKELGETTSELKAIEREDAKREAAKAAEAEAAAASEASPEDSNSIQPEATQAPSASEDHDEADSPSDEDEAADEEKPWYVPEQAGRRRTRDR